MRIDSHHHVWDLSVREQGWMVGEALNPIKKNFSINDLRTTISECGIDKTVVVQTVTNYDETPELLELADTDDLVAGVVGFLKIDAPDAISYLDKYKYWDRFPERSQQAYRDQAEQFISKLDKNLNEQRYLLGNKICVADMAIFPFIRQFAFVDKDWFDQTNYLGLQRWLSEILDSPLFTQVMKKHSVWQSPLDSRA